MSTTAASRTRAHKRDRVVQFFASTKLARAALEAKRDAVERELGAEGMVREQGASGKRKRKNADDPARGLDPLEPVYCLCRQVAFGEMIACDDPDCRVEWFHTQCVAISRSAMPSMWVCAECARRCAVMPGAGAVPAAAAGATAGAAPRGRSVASPDGGSAR